MSFSVFGHHLKSLLDFFFPRTCHVCGRELLPGEEGLCLTCQVQLPRVANYAVGNPAEMRLAGRCPFEKAVSFCYYRKEGVFAEMMHEAKYQGKSSYNRFLTTLFIGELQREGWHQDIDVVIPVPLHRRRQRLRGYNQSMPIAEAIARSWHIPCEAGCLVRRDGDRSQVNRGLEERLEALVNSFEVRHEERLQGRHILLVDDILTSGATLEMCARALQQVQSVRVSFLTLGLSVL